MHRVEVRAASGRLVGWIERCSHGSRFIQAKRIHPPDACVNHGLSHLCEPVSLDLDPMARLRAAGYRESAPL